MNGPMQNPMMTQILTQRFGSPETANQAFGAFSQELQKKMSEMQMGPSQIVQDGLNKGTISQKDFNEARMIANMMLGVNY